MRWKIIKLGNVICHIPFSTAISAPDRINTNTRLPTGAIACIFNCVCTVTRIFIDGHRLRIKRAPIGTVRLVRKFKQRTNVAYPYYYKKSVSPYFLAKVEAYRAALAYHTVLPSLTETKRGFYKNSIFKFVLNQNSVRPAYRLTCVQTTIWLK